jgi:hypothetical protein
MKYYQVPFYFLGVHSEEPRKIKITKLPVHINCEMLTTFFESKRNYVGNVLDVTVDIEHHFAIVEFDNPTGRRNKLTMYSKQEYLKK